MARHMRDGNQTAPQPQTPQPQRQVPQVPEATQQAPAPAQQAPQPTPDTTGAQRFKIPEEKPHRKWPAVLLVLVIALVGVLFVGRFVWPDFFNSIPVIGDVFGTKNEQPVEGQNPEGEGAEGENPEGEGGATTPEQQIPEHVGSVTEQQTGDVQASDGATFKLTSDMRSPVSLVSVNDDGVTLSFASDLQAGYNTVHITSCEINGEVMDAFAEEPTVSYTIHNESTDDTNSTPDPYFIISPLNGQEDHTTVTIKRTGFTAADYQSVKLSVDQTFAYGELGTGEYDVAQVNGLYVEVTRG